jgi:hypothetical protein
MKSLRWINTRVVIDMATDAVLEREGFAYDGPVAEAAGETTTTTLTEMVRNASWAQSAMYFAERPGIAGFVTKKDISGEATLVARFPIYDKVSALAIAEATDFTTNSAMDTSGSADATVSEHAIKMTVTDLTLGASVEDVMSPSNAVTAKAISEGGAAGVAAAEALQRLQDQDICALFSAFNTSTGSNSGPLTQTLFIDAISVLNVQNIPTERRVAALHAKQWQALLPVFDDANVFGAQGAQIIGSGAVGTLYGALVFETNNIQTATVSSSTVYAGAIMHPTAVGLGVKGPMPQTEAERDASLRATELVFTGVWGEVEYRGQATTSGRGGAGVYFYSNTTN